MTTNINASSLLMRAFERVQNPADRLKVSWFAIGSQGLPVNPVTDMAVRFSSVGALVREMHGVRPPAVGNPRGRVFTEYYEGFIRSTLRSAAYWHLVSAAMNFDLDSVGMAENMEEDDFNAFWTLAMLYAFADEEPLGYGF